MFLINDNYYTTNILKIFLIGYRIKLTNLTFFFN